MVLLFTTLKWRNRLKIFLKPFKAFLIKLKRGKQKEISPKIAWLLASSNSKGPSLNMYIVCMAKCETLKPSLVTVYSALMEKIICKKILYNSASVRPLKILLNVRRKLSFFSISTAKGMRHTVYCKCIEKTLRSDGSYKLCLITTAF